MKHKIFVSAKYCDITQHNEKCDMCGNTVSDGDEIYLTRDKMLQVGCVHCVLALIK